MDSVKCNFCDSDVHVHQHTQFLYISYQCVICGNYALTFKTAHLWDQLEGRKIRENFHLHCIAENIKANSEGLYPFWLEDRQTPKPNSLDESVIFKYFEDYENLPVSHEGKVENLLRIIAQKTSNLGPFDPIGLTTKDMFSLKIRPPEESDVWLNVLIEEGLITQTKISPDTDTLNKCKYKITPKGWKKIDHLFAGIHSKRVFIAMDFKNRDRPNIQKAIETACEETGWHAFPIDKKEYLGVVSDQIIAEIKQSRFIVAEFTLNNRGVYYEAGFATGHGIPVIYVVKDGIDLKELHFDTNHINHIVWKDYNDLTNKLMNRIKAVIN